VVPFSGSVAPYTYNDVKRFFVKTFKTGNEPYVGFSNKVIDLLSEDESTKQIQIDGFPIDKVDKVFALFVDRPELCNRFKKTKELLDSKNTDRSEYSRWFLHNLTFDLVDDPDTHFKFSKNTISKLSNQYLNNKEFVEIIFKLLPPNCASTHKFIASNPSSPASVKPHVGKRTKNVSSNDDVPKSKSTSRGVRIDSDSD